MVILKVEAYRDRKVFASDPLPEVHGVKVTCSRPPQRVLFSHGSCSRIPTPPPFSLSKTKLMPVCSFSAVHQSHLYLSACGMNVHHRCQTKVANLCGINQKLMAEALAMIESTQQVGKH